MNFFWIFEINMVRVDAIHQNLIIFWYEVIVSTNWISGVRMRLNNKQFHINHLIFKMRNFWKKNPKSMDPHSFGILLGLMSMPDLFITYEDERGWRMHTWAVPG